MKEEIIYEEPLSLAEVKELIKNNTDEENFRVNKLKEYLNHTLKLNSKKAKELEDKIRDLKIPRLKEEIIKKVVDLLPTNSDELKVILTGYPLTIKNEDIKRIVQVVSEYVK